MDIEGYAKKGLYNNDSKLEEKLTNRILEIKKTDLQYARKLAQAAIIEAQNTINVEGDILKPTISNVTMGEFGVGSRGTGDFYVHEKIGEVIGETNAIVDSAQLDDSGVILNNADDKYIVVTIDGIHSRLSDFPFLSGFHVARASLRDVYVMGARPVALLSDIHIGDDGDIAKIFDHIAGITTVSELTGIPLITGSTLRIGGDMVIGERMTGGVGAIGTTSNLTARNQVCEGDIILMTEGAGGGTISTTALYYNMHDVVKETINIKFLEACEEIINSELLPHIHVMTDVTNGGIRGDAKEISKTSGFKLVFEENKIRPLVNPAVYEMLESLQIDYLGVSLDALLIIVPAEYAQKIINVVKNVDININIIGHVEKGTGAQILIDGKMIDFTPRFRESAYTPIKKMIGDTTPRDFNEMKKSIDIATTESINKKRKIIEMIKNKS